MAVCRDEARLAHQIEHASSGALRHRMTFRLLQMLNPRLRHVQRRLGWLPRQKGGAFLLLGRDRSALHIAGPLLQVLHDRFPRMNLFFATGESAAMEAAAARSCLQMTVLPLPVIGLGSVGRLVETIKPNLVLATNGGRGLSPVLIDSLALDGAAVAILGLPAKSFFDRLSAAPDLIVVSPGERRSALDLGADPARIVEARSEPDGSLETGPVLEQLHALIVTKREYYRRDMRLERGRLSDKVARLVTTRLAFSKFTAIRSLDGLARHLDRPKTILCLGNGPSCEDPRLERLTWDACFRVNHSWLGRGFFEEPDMVFTGSKQTIEKLPATDLFGLHSIDSEHDILRRCAFLRRKFTYATAERLGTVDFGRYGMYAPTNGAVMLATAVRLRPARIIVAGIDLFSHPAGSYPGDSSTPNAYTVRHDRETELAFILDTLASFAGEIIMISEVLEREWRQWRDRAGAEPSRLPESNRPDYRTGP
jgi:hypothetical protein